MPTKKKSQIPPLPYGAYTEIARELRESGRTPITKSGVWRAIHESQNEEVIAFAADYLARRQAAQQSAKQALNHALARQ